MADPATFEAYLRRWDLTPDGAPIRTHSSSLLPVRRGETPAMLKVPHEAEEKFGGMLMAWWDGQGAARVLAQDGHVLLLERAQGQRSLAHMARHGEDDEATRIICDAVAALHAPRTNLPPPLIPLTEWFRELKPAAAIHGGILTRAAATARELLAEQQEVVPLHGDIHHDNVLDFGERGWLVIDPKRLVGERTFDYCNLFSNPHRDAAPDPTQFACRIAIVTEAAKLDRTRLLRWVLAWSGLSAAWIINEPVGQETPDTDLAVAALAAAALEGAAFEIVTAVPRQRRPDSL